MQKTIQEILEFGIINIDKSSGPTSFNISDFVRKTLKDLGVKKTAHFGTLDPKVTGVLPIALNRACKLTGYFLGEDKEYVGIMRIHDDVELKKIKKAIKEKFTGKILQTPPVKSRVKRQEREREIKSFKLLEKNGKDILFSSEVQGGTYIRKLLDDLGKDLGVGAHMLELRRIRAGIFKEDSKKYPSVNLYDFEKAIEEYKKGDEKLLREMIIPAEIVSKVYPKVEIKKEYILKLFQGSPFHTEYLSKESKAKKGDIPKGHENLSEARTSKEVVSVFSGKQFIGMYEVKKEGNIFAKAKFVMQPIKG